MRINPSRPLEELVGVNRGIVRQILGRCHCMTPRREQLRLCRPRTMQGIPLPLRRGWAKLALETIEENRELYRYACRGH